MSQWNVTDIRQHHDMAYDLLSKPKTYKRQTMPTVNSGSSHHMFMKKETGRMTTDLYLASENTKQGCMFAWLKYNRVVLSIGVCVRAHTSGAVPGIWCETAQDVCEWAKSQRSRLLHQERVLVRRLFCVRQEGSRLVPEPVKHTHLRVVPHWTITHPR